MCNIMYTDAKCNNLAIVYCDYISENEIKGQLMTTHSILALLIGIFVSH